MVNLWQRWTEETEAVGGSVVRSLTQNAPLSPDEQDAFFLCNCSCKICLFTSVMQG